MNKILSILVLFALLFGLFYVSGQDNANSDYIYSQTKAICSGNSCQDFLVSCNRRDFLEMKPLTGKVVFSDSWQDTRSEQEKELC